ncbi:hypothetical protein [Sphingosinicella sp. BN140058]|uniref:hypothetical protein n=1 Tax=Sphingosinicella sp. BN140058 TaxID=1892855 RepID=UPI0010132F11|nr:hypothetical protein [Sphingosinicella sp. BN140058]QAY79147.1 hypothetical protein ETR14_23380 [Sphingosinicella sp. BN140058]
MNALTGNKTLVDTSAINGWAVDADPRNDPTYPYRNRDQDPGLTADWVRPRVQQSNVEVLQSIEHIRRPAVFGTSTPPSAVSGMIRRVAFRYSESNWMHWLLLMGADRINVVEGVVEDLGHGKVPNIPGEMGVRAEWKHNKKGLATKVAVMAAIGVGAYALFSRGKARRPARASEVARLEL